MIEAEGASHAILHRDPFAYCAHPQAARAGNGDLLVVFNRAPRRAVIMHPPQDPQFHNVVIRSSDDGRSWSAPQVVPGFNWNGTECASLTTLADGRMLLNQWRFRWYPLDLARARPDRATLTFPRELAHGLSRSPELDGGGSLLADPEGFMPWARDGGDTFVHASSDHGHSWSETYPIHTAPFSGGYGMRGMCELPGGDLLLPLSDVPNWRAVFVVRSGDGGRSWGRPVEAAALPGKAFEEPSLLRLPSGRLLMLLRENFGRRLHRCASEDEGRSWTVPVALPIEGYPPHLLLLADERVLCTYGWRQPDFGVRAVLSADCGQTWAIDHAIRIRGGLPNKDLGYPCTIPCAEGWLLTVYYGQDGEGVTCIWGTRWRLG